MRAAPRALPRRTRAPGDRRGGGLSRAAAALPELGPGRPRGPGDRGFLVPPRAALGAARRGDDAAQRAFLLPPRSRRSSSRSRPLVTTHLQGDRRTHRPRLCRAPAATAVGIVVASQCFLLATPSGCSTREAVRESSSPPPARPAEEAHAGALGARGSMWCSSWGSVRRSPRSRVRGRCSGGRSAPLGRAVPRSPARDPCRRVGGVWSTCPVRRHPPRAGPRTRCCRDRRCSPSCARAPAASARSVIANALKPSGRDGIATLGLT